MPTATSPRRSHALAALAVAVALAALGAACSDGKRGRAVVLISIDTLRQDHLGSYGYGRDTTPNLDRFAREDAVLFEAAYAQAPYTLPSHMSLFTGLYPEAHGVLTPREIAREPRASRLSERIPILGELFAGAGYATSAFTDGVLVRGQYGFSRGFDEYRDDFRRDGPKNGFQRYGDAIDAWIRRHADRDFLLFLHSYDTHSPYDVPEPFRSKFADAAPGRALPDASMVYASLLGLHEDLHLDRFASLQDLVDVYDGTIAYVDHALGRVFERMKAEGLWEDALVVVTSDHGERFLESGLAIGHGVGLSNAEMLIPLLIKFPGSAHAGRRVTHVVESIDVLPTLLTACGLAVPADVQGQELRAGIDGDAWRKDHAFGVSPNTGYNHFLVRDGFKYVEQVHDGEGRLLRGHLRPMFLGPMLPLPKRVAAESPDPAEWDRVLYTDSDHDPLGVTDVFYRGDRVYDFREAPFEWRSETVADPVLLRALEDEAIALARASAALAARTADGTRATDDLPQEEIEMLKAIGYLGLLDPAAPPPPISDPVADVPTPTSPAVDRTLLHRGDAHLWKITRHLYRSGEKSLPAEFRGEIEAGRAAYLEFADAHPEKWIWVYWRLRSLELARKSLRPS